MEINKTMGYVVGAAGIIAFIISYPQVQGFVKLAFSKTINLYLMIGGLVLLAVGAYLAFRVGMTEQVEEVPIYEGHGKERKVVAYQRMHKK